MYEDGAAAKDGRLWAGDQILEVRSRFLVFLLIIFYSRLKDKALASSEVQYALGKALCYSQKSVDCSQSLIFP